MVIGFVQIIVLFGVKYVETGNIGTTIIHTCKNAPINALIFISGGILAFITGSLCLYHVKISLKN